MKIIIYSFLLTFFLNSYLPTVNTPLNNNLKPTKIVFNKYRALSKIGYAELNKLKDSLLDSESIPFAKGTALYELFLKKQLTNIPIDSNLVKTYIEINDKSIWRYEKEKGKLKGDYILINKEDGNIKYYNESRTLIKREKNLFRSKDKYKIRRNKKDKKIIQGYECYKITLIMINKDSEFGNSIYEMYVTDEIKLPIHSVINIPEFIPNLLPMEIRVRAEKVANKMEVVYELVSIE